MAVIKASNSSALLKEAIVLDLGDLRRQGERLHQAAQDKARAVLTEAHQQARKILDGAQGQGLEQGRAAGLGQGLDEGRKQGRQEALQQMTQQLEQIQKSLLEAAKGWETRRADIEREARTAVLDLALRLAEKIVRRKVQVDPQVAREQLASALGHVLRPLDVTVRICPEDRPTLEAALPQLQAQFAQFKHIQLTDDPTVARGGCVLTYGQGRIDATLDTQLRRIAELLLPGDRQESGDKGQEAGAL